jgi:AbrB family looped-hinge helix DNA binding protein
MRYGFTASISSKGQITIPKELRLNLGINHGDKVEIEIINDHTFAARSLKPVQARKESA